MARKKSWASQYLEIELVAENNFTGNKFPAMSGHLETDRRRC